MKSAFIRVNSSSIIGSGHLYRCLTLAQYLSAAGMHVTFVTLDNEDNLNNVIDNNKFTSTSISVPLFSQALKYNPFDVLTREVQLHDATETLKVMQTKKVDLLVVDSYNLSSPWENCFKNIAKKLLVIDDLFNRVHCADILLNQNYKSCKKSYKGLINAECKLLLGSKFSLLRENFRVKRRLAHKKRLNNRIFRKVLIMMGSMDNDDHTSSVLDAMFKYFKKHFEYQILLSSKAPHISNIQKKILQNNISGTIITDSNCVEELILASDFAISASGSSTYERCCLGLPSIQLIQTDNQRLVAQNLASDNCIKIFNDISQLKGHVETISIWGKDVSINSMKIVDGLGAKRVVGEIFEK